ncbi:MAG: hypothetical protein WBX25_15725 [Rhodomicrobium sp.]
MTASMAFDVIQTAPERLREVDGIAPHWAERITAAWAEREKYRWRGFEKPRPELQAEGAVVLPAPAGRYPFAS